MYSRCLSFLIAFSRLLLRVAAQSTLAIAVNRGYSLPSLNSSTGNYSVIPSSSEMMCVQKCAYINLRTSSVCSVAQYDSVNQNCIMALDCGVIKLQLNATSITYSLLNSVTALTPNIGYMLSNSSCLSSFALNFGSDYVAGSLTIEGNVNTTTTSFGAFRTALWFPSVTLAFPVNPKAFISDYSVNLAVSIFGRSFTVSFFINPGTPVGDDMPLIEFLGPSWEMCSTFRLANYGAEIDYYHTPDCSCSSMSASVFYSLPTSTGWKHITLTYDVTTNATMWYINGTQVKTASAYFGGFNRNINNVMIGATVCNRYRGFSNSFYGTISCLQLYRSALSSAAVWQAYQLCTKAAIVTK